MCNCSICFEKKSNKYGDQPSYRQQLVERLTFLKKQTTLMQGSASIFKKKQQHESLCKQILTDIGKMLGHKKFDFEFERGLSL